MHSEIYRPLYGVCKAITNHLGNPGVTSLFNGKDFGHYCGNGLIIDIYCGHLKIRTFESGQLPVQGEVVFDGGPISIMTHKNGCWITRVKNLYTMVNMRINPDNYEFLYQRKQEN